MQQHNQKLDIDSDVLFRAHTPFQKIKPKGGVIANTNNQINERNFIKSSGIIFEGNFLDIELINIKAQQQINIQRLRLLNNTKFRDRVTRLLIAFYKENIKEQQRKLLLNRKSRQIKSLDVKIQDLIDFKQHLVQKSEQFHQVKEELKESFVTLNLYHRQYLILRDKYNQQFSQTKQMLQAVLTNIQNKDNSILPEYVKQAKYPYIEDVFIILQQQNQKRMLL